MRLGDLIEWGGQRWIVRRVERSTRTAIIHDGDRGDVIPDDLDKRKPEECAVIANPGEDWPFATIAQRPKFGRLLQVLRPQLQGEPIELLRFRDWAIPEPTQAGGALFFNPLLGLGLGDMLLAVYERGRGRVQIPREFL